MEESKDEKKRKRVLITPDYYEIYDKVLGGKERGAIFIKTLVDYAIEGVFPDIDVSCKVDQTLMIAILSKKSKIIKRKTPPPDMNYIPIFRDFWIDVFHYLNPRLQSLFIERMMHNMFGNRDWNEICGRTTPEDNDILDMAWDCFYESWQCSIAHTFSIRKRWDKDNKESQDEPKNL